MQEKPHSTGSPIMSSSQVVRWGSGAWLTTQVLWCYSPICKDRDPPAALVMRSDSPGMLTPATLFLAGGLTTVIYTDALQTVIMMVGAVILAVKGEVWGLGMGGLSLHLEEL